MKKIILIMVFIFAIIPLSYSIDINNCGEPVNVAGTYTLTQDISTTGNCLAITASHITIDLNGHSITGDGNSNTDYGITIQGGYTNLTIKNGEMNNFGRAIYYYNMNNGFQFNGTIEDLNFNNNLLGDLYLYSNYNDFQKNFKIINSNLNTGVYIDKFNEINIENTDSNFFNTSKIYIQTVQNVYFNNIVDFKFDSLYIGYSKIIEFQNISTMKGNDVSFGNSNYIEFNNLNTINVTNFTRFGGNFNLKHNNDFDMHVYGNICNSNFDRVSNTKEINMYSHSNSNSTGTCIFLNIFNLNLDLMGNSITGDGNSNLDYGIMVENGYTNLTIQNGEINNFGSGLRYYSTSESMIFDIIIENINFNNIAYDIYLYSFRVSGNKNINIINSDLHSGIYSNNYNSINFNNTDSNFFNTTKIYTLGVKEIYFNEVNNLKFDSIDIITGQILEFQDINTIEGNEMNLGISNYLEFNNLNSINVTNFTKFGGNFNLRHNNIFDMHIYGNLCNSNFDRVSNIKIINTYSHINSNSTGTCLLSNMHNFNLDLMGNSITGDGNSNLDFGIMIENGYTNLTIQNGEINNFGSGLRYSSTSESMIFDSVIKNVNFNNTVYDLNLYSFRVSGNKNVNLINSDLHTGIYGSNFNSISFNNTDSNFFNTTKIYTQGVKNFYFNEVNNLRFDSIYIATAEIIEFKDINMMKGNELNLGISNYIEFNNLTSIIVTNFTKIGGNFNLRHNNIFDIYIYGNLCDSNFDRVSNTKLINTYLYRNSDSTGTCIFLNIYNFNLNLNGYSVTGDGNSNSDYGISIQGGYSNLTIQNGEINNFGTGIKYYTTSHSINFDSIIENINFNNIVYELNLYSFRTTGNKNVEIRNSNFNKEAYFLNFNDITLYGNNISNQNNITSSGTNIIPFKLVNGSNVGNFWRDFVCSNSTDNYEVKNNADSYTICNSNEYNPIGDTAPLLGLIYTAPIIPETPIIPNIPETPETPSSSGAVGSSAGNTIVLPFGNMFLGIGIIMLSLFFLN